MNDIGERDTQTKVKHEILNEYITKWGGIITNGLRNTYHQNPNYRETSNVRFIYVDYFAHTGIYTENGNSVFGSPVIGVKALDKTKEFFIKQTGGIRPSVIAVLFEKDTKYFETLLDTLLDCGFENRIKRTDNLATLQDGDIAVIKGNSADYVKQVLGLINQVSMTYSFHFVDPYMTDGVEKEKIQQLVSARRADCIINMMVNPISRFISLANKPELNPSELDKVESLDRFFGSGVWRDIAHAQSNKTISSREVELKLVDAFDDILREADHELAVKKIPLKFQDREQTLYYLFLTTHDPTGSFAMNEILTEAGIREYDYRTEKRELRKRPGQLGMQFLDELPDVNRPTEPEVDVDLLANQIYEVCKKRTLKYREVLREIINSAYYVEDVKDALMKLKTQKRAMFDGARSRIFNSTEITFL